MTGSGGSIPVVEQIKRTLGIDSLMMGFGLDDDQIHSPNEKFEMLCFHRGTRSHALLLGKLAAGPDRARRVRRRDWDAGQCCGTLGLSPTRR